MTHIGELRERVTIQEATTVSDGAGGQTVTWADVYTVWAKVQPVRGREEDRLGRLATVETYLVIVRFAVAVTSLSRLVWRGKVLNVRSVSDRDMDREFLTCECEAGVTT